MTDIGTSGGSPSTPRRSASDALPPGYNRGPATGADQPGGSQQPYDSMQGYDSMQEHGGQPGEGEFYQPHQEEPVSQHAADYGQPSGAKGHGPAHAARRQGRKSDREGVARRHPVLMVIGALVVVVVLLVAGGLFWADRQINPGGKPGAVVTVDIPKDSSTGQIGSDLAAAGVIHSSTLFRLYVKFHGDGPLYPGTYRLHKNSSYQMAITALQTGPKVATANLVIPEGFTVRQIAAAVGALSNLGLSSSKFLAAANSGSVRSPYEPAGVNNLEGLLFPATYQVRQGDTEVDVLSMMVRVFDTRAAALGLTAAAARQHETPYQLMTVASIVEREAKLVADRGPVASTIYNRLRAGMPLGADSTQTYYLRQSNPTLVPTPAQLDEPSPYNTRLVKGLPPTPIANPGIPSIQAAASPPNTTYLYFVEVTPAGKLGFASTQDGFAQLQAQCRAAGLC